ncbi:MAG: 2Fe-2S iron-sulfur cluster-binding protein [Hyphomicrobiales bacterium]
MARFHPLLVTGIKRTTRNAVVLTLEPENAKSFDFMQGQHLTFRRMFDGRELRRSYSICTGRDDGILQVGIKKVEGGVFSSWANEGLKIGDKLEAMAPVGSFHTPLDATAERYYLGFAGGSGITPILSILRTVLTREPASRFTLVYANRAIGSIMFREELEDMKNRYMNRLNIIHILSRHGPRDIELFSGRLDAEKCKSLFRHWIRTDTVDIAFICGPEPMMETIAASLKEHGLSDDQIKFELFATSKPVRATGMAKPRSKSPKAGNETDACVTLNGETHRFRMPRNLSLLEAAIGNTLDAPYACKAGVCSTCRAMVLEGEVEMMANHALEDDEVECGYVLTCQCFALGDKVVFDYDQ